MAYVALYRAYRPQKFKDVVGQEHIIKTLQHAIEMNKVAHAYLFCGPRGTGKTTLAKIMAKAMNCVHGPTIEPCCECEICKGIAKGTVSDVIEIDAASNNGADDIRALRDTVKFLPAQGKYKVYIIDEVHMLSNAAFNALLKTLEEPPKHVIFILATTEPYKLPNTILSRCQRFDFQSISTDNMLKRLHIVANEEKIKISDDALSQIATSAEGGMRDALSLFDQCISYSVNEEISLDDVLAVSGNISYLRIIELLNACISDNQTDAIMLLDKTLKEGKEVPRIANDLILFLRDALLYKNNAIIEDKLMFKNQEFINLASKLSKPIIYKWLDILNDSISQMKYSTQKRAFLELAIIKMNDNDLNDTVNLLERIESLEHTVEILSKNKNNNISTNNTNYNTNNSYNNYNSSHNTVNNSTYQVNIPSKAELESLKQKSFVEKEFEDTIKPEVKVEPLKVNESTSNDAEYITIRDIEKILYDASKVKKAKLNEILKDISEKYLNNFIIQLLCRGKVIAATSNSFIVSLQDQGFCKRVMQYENFIKIKEIFSEYDFDLEDYICIPEGICNRILLDYKQKYTVSNPRPVLENIEIGLPKIKAPTSSTAEDPIVERVKEIFNDENLKIVEE